jgi:hypothetical protein
MIRTTFNDGSLVLRNYLLDLGFELIYPDNTTIGEEGLVNHFYHPMLDEYILEVDVELYYKEVFTSPKEEWIDKLWEKINDAEIAAKEQEK